MRGRLYDDDYQPRLSGHETFPLRYGWLKKAFDAVAASEAAGIDRSVFHAEDAIARFGVGRNMVASMRHWGAAVGVLTEDGRAVTSFGRRLFADNGLDPYMEDPATSWLLHWRLCGNPRNTTWFWAFSHFTASSFERDALVRGLGKLAKDRGWPRASPSTIRNDILCFVRSYAAHAPSGRASNEDALESPLAELGLIRLVGKRDGFRFVRGPKPTLGTGTFAFAVTEFWANRSSAQTLSFEALAHEPGSPGRVFLLDENTVADYFFGIEEPSGGAYRWSETAGLKQLIRDRDVGAEEAFSFIESDYKRPLHKVAA